MTPKHFSLFVLLLLLAATNFIVELTSAQNCGCPPTLCCSKYGFCGVTEPYCGLSNCRAGPCWPLNSTATTSPPSPIVGGGSFSSGNSNSNSNNQPGSGGSGSGSSSSSSSSSSSPLSSPVADIVTEPFFNGILNQAAEPTCPGKSFYTRSAFLEAYNQNPTFGNPGNSDDLKREVSAFFAHVTHETGHLCYKEEINGASNDYCDETNTQYPCVSGKGYYGRGPIQLTWNYNYGPAGKSIGFDGLNSPETVSNDPVVSFQTALWYWGKYVHGVLIAGRGFGESIRAINGNLECNGVDTGAVNARVQYYREYCGELGVAPGENLYC